MKRFSTLILSLLLVASFATFAMIQRNTTTFAGVLERPFVNHLGAEYHNIALSLYRGDGFSDPFASQTGPTAWMPPVLPYLLYFAYWIGDGSQNVVVQYAIGLQLLATFAVAYLVLEQAKRLGRSWAGVLIVVGGFSANYHMLFQFTHDVGLLLLNNCLLWMGLNYFWNGQRSWWKHSLWGVFGGYCALSSPIQGFVWAAITTWLWVSNAYRDKADRRRTIMALGVAALSSVLIVMPWTIRNFQVFDRWMPIKSNGMYELWQSQCADDDGIFDMRTAVAHPYNRGSAENKIYVELGEIGLIEQKSDIVQQEIWNDPMEFASRVMSRFIAATCIYSPFLEIDTYNKPQQVFWKRVAFVLPLLALYAIFMFTKPPICTQAQAAISIWCLTLAPYILVSYYDRYAIPLLIVKLLIILYGWHAFATWLVERRRSKKTPASLTEQTAAS